MHSHGNYLMLHRANREPRLRQSKHFCSGIRHYEIIKFCGISVWLNIFLYFFNMCMTNYFCGQHSFFLIWYTITNDCQGRNPIIAPPFSKLALRSGRCSNIQYGVYLSINEENRGSTKLVVFFVIWRKPLNTDQIINVSSCYYSEQLSLGFYVHTNQNVVSISSH